MHVGKHLWSCICPSAPVCYTSGLRKNNASCDFLILQISTKIWHKNRESGLDYRKKPIFLQTVQIRSGAHPKHLLTTTDCALLGVRRPESEADHSPPASAEVQIECRHKSTHPPINDARRDFTFILICNKCSIF
jgi:hypothetical protein